MIFLALLVPALVFLFLIGAVVGSFLNVCIYRIPAGKSIIWPGSRCGHCFHEVRLYDNVPLLSYWLLRGRCRDCGAAFSSRYFWVELLTALTFVSLYVLDVGLNVHQLALWEPNGFERLAAGHPPPQWWSLVILHIVLACFLIVTVSCLLDHGHVPASIVATGTLAGLVAATLLPWPTPQTVNVALLTPSGLRLRYPHTDGGTLTDPIRGAMPRDRSWADASVSPRPGFYSWPVWGPLPPALPAGSWPLGLATGLAGAIVGGGSLRLIGTVVPQARRIAGLGMTAGAFLGWQPVLIAVILAVVFAIPLSRRRGRLPPLALGLVPGIVTAGFGWAWIGPAVRPIFFNPFLPIVLLIAAVTLGAVSLFIRGFVKKRRTVY